MSVFKSNNHIYAQVISDEKGVTIASASSLEKDLKSDKLNRKELAEKIGQQIAKRSIQSGVKDVAFDKGKYKYHGLIKILAHDTDMTIPIFNSIFDYPMNNIKTQKLNLSVLNNLNFKEINKKRFPVVKILKQFNNNNTLFETVLVSANDEYPSIEVKEEMECFIWGVVTYVIHKTVTK